MAEHVGMDRSFISDLENGRKVQVERKLDHGAGEPESRCER
jgi:hypothetical protein